MKCTPEMHSNIERVTRSILDSFLWPCRNDSTREIEGYLIGIPGDESVGASDIGVTPFFHALADLDAYCAEHYAEIVSQWGDESEEA